MARIIKLDPSGALPAEDFPTLTEALQKGSLLAFPTDTVYGLGTNALNKESIKRIYTIKRREPRKPLPILIKSLQAAQRWVLWTPLAMTLARRFWPGPLTLVLDPTEEGKGILTAGAEKLGIRVPAHAGLLSLLEAADVPVASTSANLSGQPAAVSGEDVRAQAVEADWILEGGRISGIESTVVDASQNAPRILRIGRIPEEQLQGALRRQ